MNGLTPAFIILLSSLVLSVFLVKREHIVVPMIVTMCFLPGDIPVTVAGLNFFPLRILAFAGLAKILSFPSQNKLKINSIDILFFTYNILGAIVYTIASENMTGAFINRGGSAVDSLIIYIVFRSVVNTKEAIYLTIKTSCVCIIVLLPFAIYEYFQASNLFSILGRNSISMRDGEIRVATTFSHAILFGSFAASLVPIFWSYFKITRGKIYLFAIACCVFNIYACSSSGPIVTLAGVIFFLFFFLWKQYSSILIWCMATAAIFIHFVREKSLWHFIYIRLSIKESSTGYHRYNLTEAAVDEFKNWWLSGYGDIGPDWHSKYWSWANAAFTDVTNHYLLIGVRGGFFTMLLFIVLCYQVINSLGVIAINSENIKDQWLWWGVNVMMISHCITFLSVAYFGQITMLLYLTIAIGALAYNKTHQVSENSTRPNQIKI